MSVTLNFHEIKALAIDTPVQVDIDARTYHGPLLDPRHGWVAGTVREVGETANGEIDLWVDVPYPSGVIDRNGQSRDGLSYQVHFTANSSIVRLAVA